MAVRLPKEPIISRDLLREVAETRLREARVLLEAECHAGAVYLGGYAVECYLKAAICFTLRWEALLSTFKVHDLDGLLRYSGFDQDLRADRTVFESFVYIVGMWKVVEDDSVRYRSPSEVSAPAATRFLKCVDDPKKGVVPWLRRVIS